MGKKGQKQTTSTQFPLPSENELNLQGMGEALVRSLLSEQYYIKDTDAFRYENEGLVESLKAEQKRYKDQTVSLQKQLDTIQVTTVHHAYGGSRTSTSDTNLKQQLNNAKVQYDSISKKLNEQLAKGTPYTKTELLEKPPPRIQALLRTLPFDQQQKVEDTLQNYGYNSKEYKQIAGTIHIPKKV